MSLNGEGGAWPAEVSSGLLPGTDVLSPAKAPALGLGLPPVLVDSLAGWPVGGRLPPGSVPSEGNGSGLGVLGPWPSSSAGLSFG